MTKKCNKCHAENSDLAHFCKECGRELEIICPQCSKVCSMSSRSCDECGFSFKHKKRINTKPFAILGSILAIVSLVVLFPTMRSCSSHYYITHPLPPSGHRVWDIHKSSEIVTDYDGNTYNTIKIGDDVWMTENMRTTHDRNGNEILVCNENFHNSENLCCCAPNDDTSNIKKFGYLYNLKAIRDICPPGWHLPDYNAFRYFKDGSGGGVEKPAKRIASKTDWKPSRGNYNVGCDPSANNTVGLSVLPAGVAIETGYGYETRAFGLAASIWCYNCSHEYRHLEIYYNDPDFSFESEADVWSSVRCVKERED